MKKVYTAATPAEAAEIVKTIYASGYPDRMVLQKMVPGGDDHMRVLTAFSDENGKVRAMCPWPHDGRGAHPPRPGQPCRHRQ